MKYSTGTIVKTRYNTWRARVTVHHVRHDKNFKTLLDAKDYIDSLVRSPRTLTPEQYYDALRAYDELPHGATLLDAARFFAQNRDKPSAEPVSTREAVRQFIEEKQAAHRRPVTITNYKSLLNKLDPEQPMTHWTPQTVARTVAPYAPTTRNNHLRAFRNLFTWACARGYITIAPTKGVSRATQDGRPPAILTVEQTRKLLDAATQNAPDLVAVIAIPAFAGIRTCELRRMTRANIDIKARHIHVPAAAAKMRQQRYVHIHPTLAAWLTAYPPGSLLVPKNYRRRITALRTLAGIDPWPTNGHRHSFASYHIALFQDAAKTAFQLGHPDADLLYLNYRNLVTKAQAQAYWRLRPKAVGG